MANLATLKAALNAAIYQNNQNAITGEALNTILNSIIDTLGAGYRYAGVATPSANPGTIDNRVFYLATAAGTYTNFGAVQLDGKKLHIFIYDTTWHDVALDVPTTAAIPMIAGSGTNSMQGKGGAAAAGDDSFAFGHLTNADDDSITAEDDGSFAIGFARNEGSILAIGNGAVACGLADNANVEANGEGSHAEGCASGGSILALNPGAHAEGNALDANITASGLGSHAEGSTDYISSDITASGEGSHAEGSGTTASGDVSHAEGSATTASSDAAHAEGDGTVASGGASHAEGFNTAASALAAHAEGNETTAQNVAEHAEGKYNLSHKKTTGTAAEQAAGSTLSSVGCGTGDNDRKNAVEVMQNGDVYVKGVGGYDGTNLNTAYSIQKIAGCDYEENYDTFSTTEIPTFRWLMYRGFGRCGAIFTANQIAEIFTQISNRLSALQIEHEPSSIVVLDSFGLIAFDPTDPISLYAIDAYFYISFYDTDADEVHFGILKLEV